MSISNFNPASRPLMPMHPEEAIKIVEKISYRGLEILAVNLIGRIGVYVKHKVLDADAPESGRTTTVCSYTVIDLEFATEQIVLGRVRDAIHDLLTHEADEWFTYMGERPFYPHKGETYAIRNPLL